MIFQHTHDLVVKETKTQTRRLYKEGDYGWMCGQDDNGKFFYSQVSNQQGDKIVNRWTVGKTYAVQPGRGQKSIARIHILSIQRQDVRQISFEDSRAEGFIDRSHFMLTWCNMHDKKLNVLWCDCFQWEQDGEWREGLEKFYEFLNTRPDHLYKAWILNFELVK